MQRIFDKPERDFADEDDKEDEAKASSSKKEEPIIPDSSLETEVQVGIRMRREYIFANSDNRNYAG